MAIRDKQHREHLTCSLTIRGCADVHPHRILSEPAPRNGFGAFLLTAAIIGSFDDRQTDRTIMAYRAHRAVQS